MSLKNFMGQLPTNRRGPRREEGREIPSPWWAGPTPDAWTCRQDMQFWPPRKLRTNKQYSQYAPMTSDWTIIPKLGQQPRPLTLVFEIVII